MRSITGMKKKSKIVLAALTCFVLTIGMAIPVFAGNESTTECQIRIFAGNAGTFNVNSCQSKYSTANVTPECITFQISKGGLLPELPKNGDGLITYSPENLGKYYVLDSDKENVIDNGAASFKRNKGTVSRSEDVVIQYGTLINGVEYTVKYIEQSTRIEIALPKIIFDEAGKEITETAPTIAGYTLASSATQTIKLVKNGANVITFEYTGNPGGTTITETTSTEVIDGGVTTSFVETEVPTYVVTATAGGGGGGGAAAGAAAGDGAAAGGVAIPDGGVPLAEAPGLDEGSDNGDAEAPAGDKQIDDQKTPLAKSPFADSTLWIWIAAILGAVIIVGGGTYLIASKKIKNIIPKK